MPFIEEYRILPECEADTCLVEMLGYLKPDHKPNNHSVVDAILHPNSNNKCRIGIIDFDKIRKQPKRLPNFILIEGNEYFDIRKRDAHLHYIIVIKPALEKFLWKAAEISEIDISKWYNSIDDLKKDTKNINARKNVKLKNFINAIQQKNIGPIIMLKQNIEKYLK